MSINGIMPHLAARIRLVKPPASAASTKTPWARSSRTAAASPYQGQYGLCQNVLVRCSIGIGPYHKYTFEALSRRAWIFCASSIILAAPMDVLESTLPASVGERSCGFPATIGLRLWTHYEVYFVSLGSPFFYF